MNFLSAYFGWFLAAAFTIYLAAKFWVTMYGTQHILNIYQRIEELSHDARRGNMDAITVLQQETTRMNRLNLALSLLNLIKFVTLILGIIGGFVWLLRN